MFEKRDNQNNLVKDLLADHYAIIFLTVSGTIFFVSLIFPDGLIKSLLAYL